MVVAAGVAEDEGRVFYVVFIANTVNGVCGHLFGWGWALTRANL